MTDFFAELRRRNVIRMAGLYLVGAWLVVQVAETLLPAFGVPDWVLRAIIIVLALGFVPAVTFAWVFEFTPDGLKRESEIDRSLGVAHHTARKLDVAVIILLLAVAALVLFKPTMPVPAPAELADSEAAEDVAGSATDAPDSRAGMASIAVLPFADLSQAGDQAYFSDGMAEEILNVLTKVEGLQVASRTSAFAFKGQEDLGIPAIARQLGVRHVLEGSVRRAGDTLRITAQLIDAETDRHLWSETFDRPLTAENVFAIQDEISRDIVAALVKELPSARMGEVSRASATTNLGAYDNYLKARALVRARRQLQAADQLLEQSLQQDPQYAPAWALRAGVQLLLGEYTDTPLTAQELAERGKTFADRALALEPDSALALSVKANMRSRSAQRNLSREDLVAVFADYERSLEIDPNNPDTLNWAGLMHAFVGESEQALASFRRCVEVDPTAAACTENEYDLLMTLGRHDEAWRTYLAAFDRGAITDQYANFELLALYDQKAAFVFASNQSRYLPRWTRHDALYDAFQNLDADHGELVRDVLEFAAREGIDVDNGYVVLIMLPLGAYDLLPVPPVLWSQQVHRYRQSPQFKRFMISSGVHDYWRKAGFPPQCQPLGADDFRCD
ncbi:tetratricopeptide repeat protein [Arenimonas aestuarii]